VVPRDSFLAIRLSAMNFGEYSYVTHFLFFNLQVFCHFPLSKSSFFSKNFIPKPHTI
jgi:hypothetical protein